MNFLSKIFSCKKEEPIMPLVECPPALKLIDLPFVYSAPYCIQSNASKMDATKLKNNVSLYNQILKELKDNQSAIVNLGPGYCMFLATKTGTDVGFMFLGAPC